MHYSVHLTIATSLSMIITFILHCIMEDVPSRQSFLQRYFIDYLHDIGLAARCVYDQKINNEKCAYLVSLNDTYYLLLIVLVFCIESVIVHYFPKLFKHIENILFILFTVEYIRQYIAYLDLSFPTDMLTSHLLVWQLSSLVFGWANVLLLPPSLLIEHGSFCVFMALVAWMCHFMFCRFLPLAMNLGWFWLLSFMDICMCLHHRSKIYVPSSANHARTSTKTWQPWSYYVRGVDKWKTGGYLGLADFAVYNMLMLLSVPPSSSILAKICIAFGSIICIQLGCMLTNFLQCRMDIRITPGIPLPVMIFSLYLFILDIIMSHTFNQCTEQ